MSQIIPLTSDGEARRTVTLNEVVVTVVTRYNYSARCWTMDLLDADDNALLVGVMLVPGVSLLKGFPALEAQIGTMRLFERVADAYQDPDFLGTDVVLTWNP